MPMMVDYVADSAFASLDQYPSLVSGRLVNRTTRLHRWGDGITHCKLGNLSIQAMLWRRITLLSPQQAECTTFTKFLFDQPHEYAPSQDVMDGLLEEYDQRHNFTQSRIVEAVGNPLAATYFWSRRPVYQITAQRRIYMPGRKAKEMDHK